MTKIKLNLHDLLVQAFGETPHIPATIDVSELLEFNDIYETDQDISDLLHENRMIAQSLAEFLGRYRLLIENCAGAIVAGGKVAILMGDYSDLEAGYVPLTYFTKQLAFEAGLRQHCTDIIRFSHGASSSRKVYRSSFIPGLHDVCMVFEKPL